MIIMYIMAFGVLLGGVDQMIGNRWGFGKKFEEGLQLMGPTALSMAGIICLSERLAKALGMVIVPIYRAAGIDPSMGASIFPMDMGGYQIAKQLAENSLVGLYSGIIVSSIFGCTLIFTIPMGMHIIDNSDKKEFSRGIILGLITMPAALIAGGLSCGLTFSQVIYQCIPILIITLLLILGLLKIPHLLMKGFQGFVKIVNLLLTIGLMIGAVNYLTGTDLIKGTVPIENAMKIVSSICIVLMGSLPLTELMQRVLRKPLELIGKRIGLDSISMTGLLIGFISPIPVLTTLKNMNPKGKLVNTACLVSTASVFGAYLGFVGSNEPDFLVPIIIAKVSGGAAALLITLYLTGKKNEFIPEHGPVYDKRR